MSGIRLNKFLANAGLLSRRNVPELLKEESVRVNDQVVTEIGIRIDPEVDKVTVSGKLITPPSEMVYIMLNKPKGVVSTASDELGRKSVTDLVPNNLRVYPVGRLDQDSTGLLLLTNDGELTNRLTHPKFHQTKTYNLSVSGELTEKRLRTLNEGVLLKGEKTQGLEIKILEKRGHTTILNVTLSEGKNRQLRRMFGIVGLTVLSLKRIAVGSLSLGDLAVGEYRYLTAGEVSSLREDTGFTVEASAIE